MSEPFFPAFLQLSHRLCLLIGGQGCAVEKAEGLLAAGAYLTVVAPHLDLTLQQWAKSGRLTWLPEKFHAGHLDGVWFVVSTLQNIEENRRILTAANGRCIFLNVVDQPEFCTVHWPATLHRSPVTVAFSSGGKSPALSGYLRRKMENLLPENMGDFVEWLAVWRQHISPLLPDLKTKGWFWRTLLEQGIAELYLSGDQTGAENLIRGLLQQVTVHAPPEGGVNGYTVDNEAGYQ